MQVHEHIVHNLNLSNAAGVACLRAQVYITPSTLHTASINSIAWAPHELGLILAVGSSDGTVSILEYSTAASAWNTTKASPGAAL